MELAKVTVKGQITIPAAIRRQLNIKDGDKVIFLNIDGRTVIENSAQLAIGDAKVVFSENRASSGDSTNLHLDKI